MGRFYFFVLFFLLSFPLSAQAAQALQQQAALAAENEKHLEAAVLYRKVAALQSRQGEQAEALYLSARYYALAGNALSAIQNLELSVDMGFLDSRRLRNDPAFRLFHREESWRSCLQRVQQAEKRLKDPGQARLITTDVDHFWEAYDAVQRHPRRAEQLFRQLYLDRATPGLADYFKIKIRLLSKFVANQREKPVFYRAIRPLTRQVDGVENHIRRVLRRMNRLYPAAIFPDIYFVIGRWSAAGTVSENGILIALDQYVRTTAIPTHELNSWEKQNFHRLEELPALIAHELVHVQQPKHANDTTLLGHAIREGMADFIGALISGQTTHEPLHRFVRQRKLEEKLWQEFSKEMHLQRTHHWIGNSVRATPDRPADLGYYVGYKICEAYYEQASNKRQAIRTMLHLQDAEAFLDTSGYAERFD